MNWKPIKYGAKLSCGHVRWGVATEQLMPDVTWKLPCVECRGTGLLCRQVPERQVVDVVTTLPLLDPVV